MRIVIAPDKYKGCLTAAQVAAHLAAGMRAALPLAEIATLPVADGGDGFLAAALASGYELCPVRARGPTGEPAEAAYARRGEVAVVELAAVCGLDRLPGGLRRPLTATSYGVGEVLAAAADQGARTIILGIGGSASTDGGAGMLQALGVELLDGDGALLPAETAALDRITHLRTATLHPGVAAADLVVACDVSNPLTGPDGAAAVYGPQKGASAAQITVLDRRLQRWAAVVAAATGTDRLAEPGAGAAGGVGFAAVAVLGASLRPGIELVLDLTKFTTLLPGTALVITGEGSMDAQTLAGKAPSGVARLAARASIPVVAVAGQCSLGPQELASLGIGQAYALTDLEPDLQQSLARAGPLLEQMAGRIAADWLSC